MKNKAGAVWILMAVVVLLFTGMVMRVQVLKEKAPQPGPVAATGQPVAQGQAMQPAAASAPQAGTVDGTAGGNNSAMDAAGGPTAGGNSTATASEAKVMASTDPAGTDAGETDGPLNLSWPAGWHVSHQPNRVDLYTISISHDPPAGASMARYKDAGDVASAQAIVHQTVQQFAQDPQTDPQSPGWDEEAINGTEFSGGYMLATGTDGLVKAYFYVSDGTTIWNGVYVGPESGWGQMKEVLSTMTKK